MPWFCSSHLASRTITCLTCMSFMSVQSQEESCEAPRLDGGYVVPAQQSYTHGSSITYACDNGRKPAVESWWATSSCQNGEWQPAPQCIDETSCVPPNIPNAKYTENPHGWYSDSEKIRITCNSGYESENQDATAVCKNGTWTSMPTCEKSKDACDAPPKIPHAIIIHQEYHDLFPEESNVTYQCEDGFTVGEGDETEQILYCIKKKNISKTVFHFTPVDKCGKSPILTNGDVVNTTHRSLTYQCNDYYKLVGEAEVVCYSDGSWSKLPTCKVTHCAVDTANYPQLVQLPQTTYLLEGQRKEFDCLEKTFYGTHYSASVWCYNGEKYVKKCKYDSAPYMTCATTPHKQNKFTKLPKDGVMTIQPVCHAQADSLCFCTMYEDVC
uniref:Sushi domain-containing protein n=1 Tax=Myripristis murdjan TaxID=586833 RepID=A0A667YNU7_9TELE